ncbi:MAG: hypothetical protein RBU25_05575, partial [Lentisphaeria bacterium]|nr:hypothetical protein [Lentisphaeria bacterium]
MKRHLVLLGVFGLVALATGQPSGHAYDIERGRSPRYDAGNPPPPRWQLPAHWLELARGEVPRDRALAVTFGASYDSSQRIEYALLTYQWLFDYRDVWLHDAPPELKFKIELSAGARTNDEP